MRDGIPTNTAASWPIAARISQFIGRRSLRGNNYRSDVINGILKGVLCRIDLGCVENDNAQCLWRKAKFSAAREFDEGWKFSREMIGDADDLHFFVDQFRVRMNRHRFGG